MTPRQAEPQGSRGAPAGQPSEELDRSISPDEAGDLVEPFFRQPQWSAAPLVFEIDIGPGSHQFFDDGVGRPVDRAVDPGH